MSTSKPIKIRQSDSFTKEELLEAFPDVDPGHKPLGSRVIVQLQTAQNKSKGGIILTHNDQETQKWNTQVGKVRAIGPVSFRNRDTLQAWPEGAWLQEGDFVRVPKFNQDKWEVEYNGSLVLFMLINDIDLLAKVDCNPLGVKAYI